MQITKVKLAFIGIDDWSRPVFKMPDTNIFFGSVNKLISYNDNQEEMLKDIKVEDLCYFGNHFNCEPHGGMYLKPGKTLEMKSGKKVELIL